MTERPTPRPPDGAYIPSPLAGIAGIILTVGIVVFGVLDSLSVNYDARATIAILAVLVGGIFGFDYRSGRWKGETRTPVDLDKHPRDEGD